MKLIHGDYLEKVKEIPAGSVEDITMRSGSTGIACVNTNRDFIGIELDETYYNIAINRINKAKERKEFSFFID